MTGEAREDQGPERLQQRLAASEARYRALVESSPVGIVVHAGGVVRFANARALEIVRATSPDQVVGREVLDFVHPDERARVTARVRGAYDAGEGAPLIEERWIAADGTTIAVEVMSTPTTWDGARASQVVFSDVSKRRRAEEDLGRLEKQLLRAQKMEAIGRLASGVAHDFNNILTAILGYVELGLILGGEDGAPAGELREIRRAAERGADLTKQLLAFSRRQPISPRSVDPAELVAEARRLLERMVGEDIRLALDTRSTGTVKIDPTQAEHILINLVVNARDAMPGGGLIEIATDDLEITGETGELPPGHYVRLRVRDQGIGMDAATAARIFEPFFSTRSDGTGLGLATLGIIVRDLGGGVTVSSAPGDGACFDVWLPASAPEPAAPAPVPRGVRRSPPAGHTLLVVEDDETVRALMVRALEDAGYHTLAAAQGDEALALARACGGAIDLLVTDVVMPGHGGRQLFEALRIGRPELRVLFMSGYPRETLAARGLLAAELPCIRKPFGLAELLGEVSDSLAGG